jgi:hypothetical protein
MATLRRGLVDTVKKAAAKVSTRGVEVATKAGTRGARALVETTVAAVKTVDKLQEKLGRRSSQARSVEQAAAPKLETKPTTRASRATGRVSKVETRPTRGIPSKSRRATTEAQPMVPREAGRKTMPAAAPKRSKAAAQTPGFKVKRGQKHRHTGR